MNLILAVVWLVGAGLLFVYEYQTGDQRLRIRGTDLSIGWLLLVLGLYNLARWFSSRSGKASERVLEEMRTRHHQGRHSQPRAEEPPDPNFNFTDEPPSPKP
jgi:hypothetical protein